MTDLRPLMSADAEHWHTPAWLLDAIREAFGQIDLDPCSCDGNPTGAIRFLTPESSPDGLASDWCELAKGGLVFANPPYGGRNRIMDRWAQKADLEARRGANVLLLVPARTDTAWWHCLPPVRGMGGWIACFLQGRLKFTRPPGSGKGRATASAPFPSVLLYAGRRKLDQAMRLFERLGGQVRV